MLGPTLWAVSDLHAAVKANQAKIDLIQPRHEGDWLIVAGDVAEKFELIVNVMGVLAQRFEKVIWAPGNHELFSSERSRYRGRDKYVALVQAMRELGVVTPEDPYPVFHGITVAPLFTLYDYSFRPRHLSVDAALKKARDNNILMTDEFAIRPFVDTRAWCWERLAYTTKRLSRVHGKTILVNHWPLVKEPTHRLFYGDIAMWCGTRHTRSWPKRFQAQAVVYGHLHIPGTVHVDGIPHIEVSLGYPREWQRWPEEHRWPYPVWEVNR